MTATTARPRTPARRRSPSCGAVAQPPEVRGRAQRRALDGVALPARPLAVPDLVAAARRAISANGVTGLMILVGWCDRRGAAHPRHRRRRCSRSCSASCRCSSTAATARSRGGAAHRRPPGSSSTRSGTTRPRRSSRSRSASAPPAARSRRPRTTSGRPSALALALVIVLNKALNDMVHVARANAGLDQARRHAGRVRADRTALARHACAGPPASCRSTGCTTRSS